MRIIFVRHGNPNYELDCLTELGHVQAAAVAERLADEKIERYIPQPVAGRSKPQAIQRKREQNGLSPKCPLFFCQ